jgi:SSS family solute:Na+ symporter
VGLSVGTVIAVVGIIVLLYTYSGGLWAVGITDFIQFVILIAISMVVLPLSIQLGGGLDHMLSSLPPLSFHPVYLGQQYDAHYPVGIFLVTTFGIAAGGAQRFSSVANEQDAKKMGEIAAALFLTFPFVFGVPPLVARVVWPDLSTVPFFQNVYQPRDLGFLAVIAKVLPPGLVGMFFAALLAATFIALGSLLILFGASIYYFGKRSAAKSMKKIKAGLQAQGLDLPAE